MLMYIYLAQTALLAGILVFVKFTSDALKKTNAELAKLQEKIKSNE